MIKKAKSIKNIFDEIKDFDLVITNDAPLATALNKLVNHPRLGYLAMTPRQIASDFAGIYMNGIFEKSEIMLSICRDSGKPLKLIHGLLSKIYDMWNYNAKLEFLEQYLSEYEIKILNMLKDYPSVETAMENFNEDFFGSKKIAVVGEDLFTLLDKEVFPRKSSPAAIFDVFEESAYKIDKTFLFSNTNSLVDNIAGLIENDIAGQTAIVVSPQSNFHELIRIRLKEKGIKIEEKSLLSSNMTVRKLINFIEFSLNSDSADVREFAYTAVNFNLNLPKEFYNYDMGMYVGLAINDNSIKSLVKISRDISKLTYKGLLEKLSGLNQFILQEEFHTAIELMNLSEVKINHDNFESLKYFLREIDAEMKSEAGGVIFVNALNSAFIDRDIVFYIGLDNSWMKLFPEKDYLDRNEEEKKNLLRFQILLQQGSQRYYFVRNISEYKEVIPCYYFSQIYDRKINNFKDEIFNPVIATNKIKKANYEIKRKVKQSDSIQTITSLSPTSLNNYFFCPKYYSVSKLLTSEHAQNMTRGSLMHNFAELYFNHPDFAIKKINEIKNIMTDELKLFNSNLNSDYINSEFDIAIRNVIRFIDSQNIKKVKSQKPQSPEDNLLMRHFGKDKIYINTERWINDTAGSGIKGKIDLYYDSTIVDYKTSATAKKESAISLQSNPDVIKMEEYQNFDFQAMAYLTAYKTNEMEKLFIYNYLLSNSKDYITDQEITDKNLVSIRFINLNFFDYIKSDEFINRLIQNEKTEKLMDKAGKFFFIRLFDNLNLSYEDYFNKEKLKSRVIETAVSLLNELNLKYSDFGNKRHDTFIKDCIIPIVETIFKIRIGNDETGFLFKDDSDKFVSFVKQCISEINEFNKSVYPFRPAFGLSETCKGCSINNLCIGNKIWH